MKKQIATLLVGIMLVGCGSNTAESTATPSATPVAEGETVSVEGLNILAPTGAPGYALMPIVKEGNNDVTMVDGSDPLQAAFVNPNPEYDVIIAPTNLGAKLSSAGKTTYKLAGIITTGNLYIVAEDEAVLEGDGNLALFGEGAVPGLVYNSLYPETSMNATWYPSVAEAQAALLSGNADAALLADPAATAAIAKGSESGLSLKKVADLQAEWGENGYPQAGLFVEESTLEENKAMYKSLMDEIIAYADGVKDGSNDIAKDLEEVGSEQFGATPAAMVSKAYAGMGINPYYAEEDTDNLSQFLELFGVTLGEDTVVSLQ